VSQAVNRYYPLIKGGKLDLCPSLSHFEITAIRSFEPIIIDNWIILFTHVNSHEASVCKSLLDLGADVAFCLSLQKEDRFRIIVRSSEGFQMKTNIRLGNFMETLGAEFSGSGGGHKGAAGMNCVNPPKNIKEIIVAKLKKELNIEI